MKARLTEQNRPFDQGLRGSVFVWLYLAATLLSPAVASAQDRVALVVGVGAYKNVGALTNVSPFIAPSITRGAVIRSCRSAATKVVVFL